jgi:hypothetical protein
MEILEKIRKKGFWSIEARAGDLHSSTTLLRTELTSRLSFRRMPICVRLINMKTQPHMLGMYIGTGCSCSETQAQRVRAI